jgi:hypothetical protein
LVKLKIERDTKPLNKKKEWYPILATVEILNPKLETVYLSKARSINPLSTEAEMEFAIENCFKDFNDYVKKAKKLFGVK